MTYPLASVPLLTGHTQSWPQLQTCQPGPPDLSTPDHRPLVLLSQACPGCGLPREDCSESFSSGSRLLAVLPPSALALTVIKKALIRVRQISSVEFIFLKTLGRIQTLQRPLIRWSSQVEQVVTLRPPRGPSARASLSDVVGGTRVAQSFLSLPPHLPGIKKVARATEKKQGKGSPVTSWPDLSGSGRFHKPCCRVRKGGSGPPRTTEGQATCP